MKVHLITSRPTLENDIDTLRAIISAICDSGHSVAYDWIEDAYQGIKDPGKITDWFKVYKNNLEVISKSDVVIAEASYENFGVGYQVATAVQQKKPILLLRHEKADKNAFATGVEDGWVRKFEYNSDSLKKILNQFLQDNDIQSKDMRFNFFIDRQIYNYLRWKSYRTGKTKAEILRSLVIKEIENKSDY